MDSTASDSKFFILELIGSAFAGTPEFGRRTVGEQHPSGRWYIDDTWVDDDDNFKINYRVVNDVFKTYDAQKKFFSVVFQTLGVKFEKDELDEVAKYFVVLSNIGVLQKHCARLTARVTSLEEQVAELSRPR